MARTVNQVNVTMAQNTATVLLPGNVNRVALLVGSSPAGGYWLNVQAPMSAVNRGVSIPTLTQALLLTKDLVGEALSGPIHGFTDTVGGITVGIIEVSEIVATPGP